MTIENLINCLNSRLNWYSKAIKMHRSEIKCDNHFDWPTSSAEPRNAISLHEWLGAARELSNTLDMLNSFTPEQKNVYPKYKEFRSLNQENLQRLCINKNWYTAGSNEQYDELLSMCITNNVTTDIIAKMAKNIKINSDTEHDIQDICFEIARICHNHFTLS